MKGRKDVSVEYTENVFDDESRRDCDGKIGGEKPRAGEYDAVSDISITNAFLYFHTSLFASVLHNSSCRQLFPTASNSSETGNPVTFNEDKRSRAY